MASDAGPPGRPVVLEARRIDKTFPGARALSAVDLTVHRGEVVAVIGENGAGKSTLARILAGVETQDRGEVRIDGRPVVIDSVRTATALGIALIHQELDLCDNLTVAGNVFLGREPHRFGVIDERRIEQDTERILRGLGLGGRARVPLGTLSIAQQQLCEIAKALSIDARILIMDEPTSSLARHETERLGAVVDSLRERGVSIVYISHRLAEVERLADRVVVLRDGENAGSLERHHGITHDAMVRLMVGRDLAAFYRRTAHTPGAPMLEVRALRTAAHPEHRVDLTVRAGEIVGVAGLVGAGRTELLRALFGIDPPRSGEVQLGGHPVRIRTPVDAIRAGLALVPEDRKAQGLVLDLAVRQNLALPSLRRDQRHGFVDRRAEERIAQRMVRELSIKAPDLAVPTRQLSGGNQQKVVLGKWLALEPRVLLLDEPTRGIDVSSKQEIYRLMDELASRGVAILFASSELEEILGVSDRVLVMHEGAVRGELGPAERGEQAIMQLATGGATPAPARGS